MLFSTVIETLQKNGINPSRDKLVIGVSGGIDSMVLFSVLHKLNFDLIVVHVNYHTRAEASDKDQELVVETTEQYGHKCIVHSVYPDQVEGNFQKWARSVRYQIFEKIQIDEQAKAIAVAHHLDDQVETILQKIMRGAGIESWQGMPVFEGKILRPLLSVSRKEISEYADIHNISYRNDQSNFESNYARNFLRNEWIPHMDKLMPGWQTNINDIPQKAAVAEEALSLIAGNLQPSPKKISRDGLLALSDNLQKSVINCIIKNVYGLEQVPSASSLQNLVNLKTLQTGSHIELKKNLVLYRDRDTFVLKKEFKSEWKELVISIDKIKKNKINYEGLELTFTDFHDMEYDNYTLYMDVENVKWPFTIRNWNEGDRFQPLGMHGHKKISDHLTDEKIDASIKNEALVLVSFEDTICAVIFPQSKKSGIGNISELVKCSEATEKVLVIKRIDH
jgi:tRNA(Ile)-lysidine synthase